MDRTEHVRVITEITYTPATGYAVTIDVLFPAIGTTMTVSADCGELLVAGQRPYA
jgi:hypothetical protein